MDKTTKIEVNLTNTKDELSQLYRTLEKTKQDISAKIDNVEKMLSDEIDELSKDLSKAEEQTVDLFKYKWLAFGGGTVVLWVFSNIEAIKKLFAIK